MMDRKLEERLAQAQQASAEDTWGEVERQEYEQGQQRMQQQWLPQMAIQQLTESERQEAREKAKTSLKDLYAQFSEGNSTTVRLQCANDILAIAKEENIKLKPGTIGLLKTYIKKH